MAERARKVAIFDVDGTIFRSSLLIELVEMLIENGDFPAEAQTEYAREYAAWLDREGEYESYIDAVVRTFRKHIKGLPYDALKNAGQHMVAEHWKRTYRYSRDLLRDLKQRGYFLLAVSHSPKTVLDLFCPRLGFDKSYGILYETGPQDRFTGVMLDEHLILNKGAIAKRAVEKEGLTFENSIGVGDTESDIPFLELVDEPICFNPNLKLYKEAKRMGWQIKVERKDVIYDIE